MGTAADDRMEQAGLAQLAFALSSRHVQLILDPAGSVLSINGEAQRAEQWEPDDCLGRSHELFYSAEEIADGLPTSDLANAAREGAFEREMWRRHLPAAQMQSYSCAHRSRWRAASVVASGERLPRHR